MKTNLIQFLKLYKSGLLLIPFLTLYVSAQAQTPWEIEREKEHGVLRLRINKLNSSNYYFIYKNPISNRLDTIRNQEAPVDLGNTEPHYTYSFVKLLKALPPCLYGKNCNHIYQDWSYVSFPILGLNTAQVFLKDKRNGEEMKLDFQFNSYDTADYVFEFNFQKGSFFIDAPELKEYLLQQMTYNYKSSSSFEPDKAARFKTLKNLSIKRSQTQNQKLSILQIGNLDALEYIPFYDRIRYSSPTDISVHFNEQPFYKKIKYQNAYKRMLVPEYLKADTSNPYQNAYHTEQVYVKPLYLYNPLEDTKTQIHHIGSPMVNRIFNKTTMDTTFLKLESYLEKILFSKESCCNESVYEVSTVNFPFNTDSLLSIEVVSTTHRLPTKDSLQLARYKKALLKAQNPKKKWWSLNLWKWKKNEALTHNSPYIPQMSFEKLPMPNYDIEIPQACDSLLKTQPSNNNLNNGYFGWEAVEPCLDMNNPDTLLQEFFSFVVNPYSMKPYDPELLFGPRFRELVYQEMKLLYNQLEKEGEKYPFNIHHYHPDEKRHFMWGLDKNKLIIYFGNEGEFTAYRKHLIPIKSFTKKTL